MPTMDHDALRLQRALLGERYAIDWDGIFIAMAIVAVGFLLAVIL